MPLSRRKLLLGTAAAVVAYPVVRTGLWQLRDENIPDFTDVLPDPPAGKENWVNFGGNQTAVVNQIAYPESEEELIDIITKANKVRPSGSSHSWTGLVKTDDTIVRLDSMSGLLNFDEATGDATFGAGTLIYEAAEALYQNGRSLLNLPDINVQALAGAFSTGTHGTGVKLKPLHDYVKGFRLITASGEAIDVDAQSNPDLFQAGKVSLGALGIITQYTINTAPLFRLHRKVEMFDIDELLERIDEFKETYRNFEFFYISGTRRAAGIFHQETDDPVDVEESYENKDDNDVLEELLLLRNLVGWSPFLRRKIFASQIPLGLIETKIKSSHEVLSNPRQQKFSEMEYHVPAVTAKETFKETIEMMDARKAVAWPIEFRWVAQDDAWLSPFNDQTRCSIAIHREVGKKYDHFFTEFEPMFLKYGGRPHWGKMHTRKYEDLKAMYPRLDDFNAIRKQLDPTGKFMNQHLADIFGETYQG